MRPSRSLCVRTLLTSVASAALALSVGGIHAQQSQPASQSPTRGADVPRLIQFNDALKDSQNKPLSRVVAVRFAIYAGQEDDAPLWMEVQNVTPGADGSYTVLLGSASRGGVPSELFSKGEARWLGVETSEQPQRPRVLLVSVPYALKAADADTLGGLPASAFLTAASLPTPPAVPQASNVLVAPPTTSALAAAAPTGAGTANYLPLWTSSTNLGNSILYQTSGKLQVGGSLQLPAGGTATSTTGFNSRPLDFITAAYNSSTNASFGLNFRWQAEPVSNNTTAPLAKLNLLFASGAVAPAETGLSINSKGQITFAPGQTLPAATVTGNETVKGTVSGTQLISTVATGTAPLKVTSTTQVANLNASYLGGLAASAFALRGAANTFIGTQTVSGNVNLTGSINGALTIQGNVTGTSGYLSDNLIGGFGSTVRSGVTGATIGGGGATNQLNAVLDDFGTVGGGAVNIAGNGDGVGRYATVAGGLVNSATGFSATVAGGQGNTASGLGSFAAGNVNTSSGFASFAAGDGNIASGGASFAAGYSAHATAEGSFVWCQYDGAVCDSGPTRDTFLVAVKGPIYMFDGTGGQGCYLNPGTAGWQCSSDRNLKNNFHPVEPRSVLERVLSMPISQWSMKADKDGRTHIGPMAQDFYAAFGLGDSDKYIGQGDAQGVALASIQGLYQLLQEKNGESRRLQEKLVDLEAQLQAIQERLARFEAAAQVQPR